MERECADHDATSYIASGKCGENTGLFSDGMTEKRRDRGNGISGDDEFMADCAIVWFILSVFSVYLSFCFLWFLRRSSGG
jgi:hypothetical protein